MNRVLFLMFLLIASCDACKRPTLAEQMAERDAVMAARGGNNKLKKTSTSKVNMPIMPTDVDSLNNKVDPKTTDKINKKNTKSSSDLVQVSEKFHINTSETTVIEASYKFLRYATEQKRYNSDREYNLRLHDANQMDIEVIHADSPIPTFQKYTIGRFDKSSDCESLSYSTILTPIGESLTGKEFSNIEATFHFYEGKISVVVLGSVRGDIILFNESDNKLLSNFKKKK